MLKSFKKLLVSKKSKLTNSMLTYKHPLQYLFLEVTRKCNLECVYCGSDCSPGWDKEELSIDAWIAFMEQVAQDFRSSDIMIAIMGGEPLVKPHIYDLLNEINRLGFPWGMVSNGTCINVENAQKLVTANMGSIALSMDAPPEINDTLRGVGTSAHVEQAIKNLKQAQYKGKLEVISSITKPAVAHLDEMRRHLAVLKVPLWRIVPIFSIGRAANRNDLLPDEHDLREILTFVTKSRQDGKLPKPEFGEECYLGDLEGIVRPYQFQCRAGLSIAGIMYDGHIGACPELSKDFIQGHINQDTLKQVWENKYQIFRDRSWTHRGMCSQCDAYETCQGGSLHLYQDGQSDIARCFYKMVPELTGFNNQSH